MPISEHPDYCESLASIGMSIDAEGRYRVLEPDRPVTPLGALCECTVRVQLRLCILALREQLEPLGEPCAWCKKSRGWKTCADHGLLEDLERAADSESDIMCAWNWAYALGTYHSDAKYAWGFWTEPGPKLERQYVRGASDDAANYARAIMGAM